MRNTLAKLCPELPVIMIEAGNKDVEQLVFGGAETEVAWLLTLGYRTPTTIGEEKPSLLKAKTLVLLPSPDVVCSDIMGSSITFSTEVCIDFMGLMFRESARICRLKVESFSVVLLAGSFYARVVNRPRSAIILVFALEDDFL